MDCGDSHCLQVPNALVTDLERRTYTQDLLTSIFVYDWCVCEPVEPQVLQQAQGGAHVCLDMPYNGGKPSGGVDVFDYKHFLKVLKVGLCHWLCVSMYVCMYVCTYVCMYVCILLMYAWSAPPGLCACMYITNVCVERPPWPMCMYVYY